MSKWKDVGGRASIEAKPGLDLKNAVRQLLPRRLGPHRILAGPLRGRRIFTSWHDYPAAILGRTEVALINWLRRNVSPGETWLDIGAHYGYTAIAICELVGPHGRVFAFEPLLATAGYLSLTRDLNAFQQLTIVPFGLDDSTSMRTLQVATRRGMATPLEGDVAPHNTIYLTGFEAVWDMLADGDPAIHGVKMDVQGMEIAALRGMERWLNRFHPKLVVEIHPGVDRPTFLSTVADVGYEPTGMTLDPLPGELVPGYIDDRSYIFEAS